MQVDVNEIEVADYNILENIKAAFYRLWKLKLIVVFATAIGLLLSIAYIIFSGDSFNYYSNATIYSAVYGSYSETVSGVSIMNTYSSVLNSTRVCERAAAEISDSKITAEYLKELASGGKVYFSGASTESKSYGYKLILYTRLDNPDNVVTITNAMANAFVGEINELLGADVIQVFDKATVCFANSTSISKTLLIAIFCAVGFILSAGIIFVKEFFSSKIYLVSQCEKNKDLVLGIIPVAK